MSKTSLASIEVRRDELSQFAQILGCKTDVWPLKYLGLPLGGFPRSLSFWDLVIERIQDNWIVEKDITSLWEQGSF